MGAETRAVAPVAQSGLAIRGREDLEWVVERIAKSGLAPRDMNSPDKIAVAVMHGMEVGLSPMQAIQSIAVINGRPSIWGDAALGLVYASGALEHHEEGSVKQGEVDDWHGYCTVKRRGQPAHTATFSVGDAKRAGLWKKSGPWTQYSQRMLVLRARSWAIRDRFPDALKGLAVAEEARDIPATEYTVSAHAQPRGAIHFGFGARQESPQPSPAEATVDRDDGDADGEAGLDVGDAWEGDSDAQQ